MKKITMVMAMLALALSLGMSFSPLVLAEGKGEISKISEKSNYHINLADNAIHPLFQISKINPVDNYLKFTFNPEDNKDYTLKRLVTAVYSYDIATPAMAEAEIEQLMSDSRPTWSESWSSDTFNVNSGTYATNFKLTDWKMWYYHFLNNNPGVLYYAVEYADRNNEDTEWLVGKLSYRDCTHVNDFVTVGYTESTICLITPDASGKNWEYTREDADEKRTVGSWDEELAARFIGQLLDIEVQTGFFTPDNIESERERLYQEILRIRRSIADTEAEQRDRVMKQSYETYKVVFGIYEEGHDPNPPVVEPVEPVEPVIPVEPIEPVEPVVPVEPVNPVEPVVPEIPNPPVMVPEEKPEKPIVPKPPVNFGAVNGGNNSNSGDGISNIRDDAVAVVVPGNIKNDQGPVKITDDNGGNSVKNDQRSEDETVPEGERESVQIPALSDSKVLAAVAKKTWAWPFWIILACGGAMVGWLGVRVLWRYRKRNR